MSEERAIEFWNKDTNEGAYITARRNTHEEFWVVEVELGAFAQVLEMAGFKRAQEHEKD